MPPRVCLLVHHTDAFFHGPERTCEVASASIWFGHTSQIHSIWFGRKLLPECDVIGAIDADALLPPDAGPLHLQPQIAQWLASPRFCFVARGPYAVRPTGDQKDFPGLDDLGDTDANTGFMLLEARPAAAAAESETLMQRVWWCAVERVSPPAFRLRQPVMQPVLAGGQHRHPPSGGSAAAEGSAELGAGGEPLQLYRKVCVCEGRAPTALSEGVCG